MVNSHRKGIESITGKIVEFIRKHHEITIIGLGNRNRSDDGAGIAVAMGLKKKIPIGKICVMATEKGLLHALPVIEKNKPDGLIVIDAAELGADAGSCSILGPDSIEEKGLSTHENTIIPALAYLSAAGSRCDIIFICIQYGTTAYSKRLHLSTDVENRVEELSSILSRLLCG